VHSPACETWRVHLARCWIELGDRPATLREFVDDTLHSWETELLVSDPEFEREFNRLTDETRQSMDLARRITSL